MPVVELLVHQQAEALAVAERAHHLAGAVRALGHAVLRDRVPEALDQAVHEGIVRRPVDREHRDAAAHRREPGELPVADMAGEHDPPAGGAHGLLQMGAAHELDPPARPVDREAVQVRVLRGDAAEMAPHAADGAPGLRLRQLGQRAGDVVEAAPVHRQQRPDQAAEGATESGRPVHRQHTEEREQGARRGGLAKMSCGAHRGRLRHRGCARSAAPAGRAPRPARARPASRGACAPGLAPPAAALRGPSRSSQAAHSARWLQ